MDSMGSKKRIVQDMSSNVFPEITFRDGRWFLRYWCNGELVKEIDLPNEPMLNNIWKATAMLLDVYVDDCSRNYDRCVDYCNQAKNIFAGASQLCQDKAHEYQELIDLDNLYAPDDNEPWYNK